MLTGMRESGPGYADQDTKRMFARVVGILCLGVALVLLGMAFADFLSAMNSSQFGAEPRRIWMFFAALPFFVIGGIGINAGFMGAGARYAAGELAPTARETLGYLGVDDVGHSCPSCGARNADGATFCDNCGVALKQTCPSCQHPNAADAKFCAACGTPLM
jgi:Double zinc ribbon